MLAAIKNYAFAFASLNKDARLLLMYYFLRSISAGMTFFIGIFLAHIHMKVSIIGLEVSAIALGNMVGSWVAARYSDKFNPYKLSCFSLVAQGLCFLLISVLQNPFLLAVTIFLNGAASYFYISVSSFLITSAAGTCENSRAQAIGFKAVVSNLGIGIGGVIVSLSPNNMAYVSFIFMGLVLLFLSYCYFRVSKDIDSLASTTVKAKETNSEFNSLQLSFVLVGLMGLIIGIQRVGMQYFYEESFTSSQVGFVIMINTILIISCMPGLISFLKNKNHVYFLGIGSALLGIGTSMHVFCSTFIVLSVLCIIRTFGEMLMSQESEFLCFQSAKPEERGWALGVYKLLFSLGTTIGAILSGEILEVFGINVIWSASAAIGGGAFCVCYLHARRESRRIETLA